ncbi:hypothetical protein [Rhodosalinus sp. K401]|uniref:hypothetical protein n=1 Tax=Rhodosalinus sp. K401 TaxID=3239195 RepID=UPI00352417EA
MLQKKIILAFFVISLPEFAYGQVYLKGIFNCGSWLDARDSERSVALGHAAQGFLNGLALGSNQEFWNAPDKSPLTPNQVFYWLDRECSARPLSNVYELLFTLFDERIAHS